MKIEISKTEKALRLIATEGISAKEAAERVGISRAAVSKGKLWPSKSTQNIRKLCEMENEIESLRSELAALKAENENLRNDAELWRGYQKRKQDLLDRGFLRSPLRADELDAMAQGEKG